MLEGEEKIMNLKNDSLTWIGFLALVWMAILTIRVSAETHNAIGFITTAALLTILAILLRMDRRIRKLEEK